jgi:hypothetical protein
MLTKFRARISSAHVLAAVAVFMALGGAAYAVKSNSVGSKQLKKNAVTTKKIKDAAVTTGKLADNAATGAKVDEASLSKVPHATRADHATQADHATTAVNSVNSLQLNGQGLAQVRSTTAGSGTGADVNLPDGILTDVFTLNVNIPAGGANVVANASVTIGNDQAGQSTADCLLQIAGANTTQTISESMEATTGSVAIPLAGFRTNVLPAGGSAPVRILCASAAGSDTTFDAASLNVTVTPSQ